MRSNYNFMDETPDEQINGGGAIWFVVIVVAMLFGVIYFGYKTNKAEKKATQIENCK